MLSKNRLSGTDEHKHTKKDKNKVKNKPKTITKNEDKD